MEYDKDRDYQLTDDDLVDYATDTQWIRRRMNIFHIRESNHIHKHCQYLVNFDDEIYHPGDGRWFFREQDYFLHKN